MLCTSACALEHSHLDSGWQEAQQDSRHCEQREMLAASLILAVQALVCVGMLARALGPKLLPYTEGLVGESRLVAVSV